MVADPNDRMVLKADLSDGDGLHPNYLGYAAMGNSIDLRLFINDENVDENVDENEDENEEDLIHSDEENIENDEFFDSEVTAINEAEDSIDDE